MKTAARDYALILFGAIIGYVAAVSTRQLSVPFLVDARAYVLTHRIEVSIGIVMLGLIIYLGGGGSGRRK